MVFVVVVVDRNGHLLMALGVFILSDDPVFPGPVFYASLCFCDSPSP